VTAVATFYAGRAGIGAVHQALSLPDLVYLFLEGDHPEFTEPTNQLEALHVERAEAGVIEALRHHAKRVTHEDLIHAMTG
jgi:hypothetical protein